MIAASALPSPVDAARRERAKMRLYVLCQVVGWGVFLAIQIFFSLVFGGKEKAQDPVKTVAMVVMIVGHGLLLTHYMRPLIARWGWRELGWRHLFPRVLATALILSAVWSAIGYGYTYGVLQEPWDSKYSILLIFSISWINGALLLGGWYCFYFIYHLFDRFNRS